jgi:acetoacetyl-CoA synthetase
MPTARWFPGATINYAEHALRRRDDATRRSSPGPRPATR